VAADFEKQLTEEARPLLEPVEEILASIVAQPPGTGVSRSGGGMGPQAVGQVWARKSRGKAEAARLELTTPMGLATQVERAKATA
jgi:hypothetical protein